MENIDKLFQRSQTEMDLKVHPSAWRRLNSRLERRKNKRQKKWHFLSIAASFVLLLYLVSSIMFRAPEYGLEDLSLDGDPMFTKQDINSLYQYYAESTYSFDLNG